MKISYLLLLGLLSWNVNAEDKLPSSIALELLADSNEGRHGAINLEIFFPYNVNMHIGSGSSHLKGEDLNQETSTNFSFGLASDPSDRFSIGLDYEFWGLKNELTVNNFYLPLQFNFKHWVIGFRPGRGEVRAKSLQILGQTREYTADDKIWGATITYLGFKRWRLRTDYEQHRYSEDISRMAGRFISLIFSDATLGLASSLQKNIFSLTTSREFSLLDVSVDITHSESAFDNSRSNTVSLIIDYFLRENFMLSSLAGVTSTSGTDPFTGEKYDPTYFAGAGITYSWQ